MTPRPAISGNCEICGKPARCYRTVRVSGPKGGRPVPGRVLVCNRHYSMHQRFGRFYNLKVLLPRADQARARELHAQGEKAIVLAERFGVSYSTMRRYLEGSKRGKSQ